MPTTSSAKPAARSLLKVLGVAFGVAIIVGNTIGSGILRTPGEIAAALPSAGWFMGLWFAGGLYALCGAMTMAELAVMIPKSGGQYVYARRALGEYPGFVIGWTDWISVCAATALASIALGELSATLIPSLAPYQTAIAVTTTLAFTAIHWIGVRSGDRTQQLLSVLKTLALLAIAAACLTRPAATDVATAARTIPSGMFFASALVLSFQGVLYTYDGWNGLVYFSGEVKDPGREIPKAMMWGVIAVTVVYIALNWAFLHVLGIDGLSGEKFAAVAAAKAVFGATGKQVAAVVTAVSLLGNASAILMQAPRVPYAMAEDGLLSRRITTVNAGGTPTTALFLSAMVSIILIVSGTFQTVIALAAFFYVVQYATTFASLFVLRYKEPDTPRPYRAWGYPVIPAIVLVGALAFLAGSYVTDTANSLPATCVLVASYPVYLITRRLVRK